MAITNGTFVAKMGQAPGDPAPAVLLTLDLDNNYPAGGYADFKQTVLDAVGDTIGKGDITILHVGQNNSPGAAGAKTLAMYDRANDKLVCVDFAGAEHAGAADLSSVVGLELVVWYK